MSFQFHPLLPDQVPDLWSTVKGRLHLAMEHGVGESTLVDWLRALLNGQAQLWILSNQDLNDGTIGSTIRGVVLTQFLNYSRCTTLHVVLAQADDFREMYPFWHILEDFGKTNGCVAAEVWGRAGWAKLLPKTIEGFQPAYQVMRKEFR